MAADPTRLKTDSACEVSSNRPGSGWRTWQNAIERWLSIQEKIGGRGCCPRPSPEDMRSSRLPVHAKLDPTTQISGFEEIETDELRPDLVPTRARSYCVNASTSKPGFRLGDFVGFVGIGINRD
jgi:hypothetical protein